MGKITRRRRRWPVVIVATLLLIGGGGLVAWYVLTDWPTVPKAQGACPADPAEAAEDAGIHAPLDSLLRAYVQNGVVDYRCLAVHRDTLTRQLAAYADVNAATLSRNDQLAFWINAYNAATLEVILRHYPQIDSIRELGGGLGPWKSEHFNLGGRSTVTLDEIEHAILRKMDEPRIHFAIVCASLGCPPLRAEAFVPARLDDQLDDQARTLFADTGIGARLDADGTLRLTRILDWFGEDFGPDTAARLEAIRHWLPPDLASRVTAQTAVAFLDWDWSLNGH